MILFWVHLRKVASNGVEEGGPRIRRAVVDNHPAEAEGGHKLAAVEAGHSPAAVVDRIRPVAEVVHNHAAELGTHPVVARNHLGPRTVLVAEPHIALVEALRIPD